MKTASILSTAFSLCISLSAPTAAALPQQTQTQAQAPGTTLLTGLPRPTSTPLSCNAPSTVKTTTDCTYGFPVSYCHTQPPPVTCAPSSYPAVGHNRCDAFTFCAPVPTTTSSCNEQDGFATTGTATLYSGTLAGECTATVIATPLCGCSGYYSYETHAQSTATSYRAVCMPLYNSQVGATTSVSGLSPSGTCAPYFTSSTWTYTLTDAEGSIVTRAGTQCYCPPGSTPSYTQLANNTPTCIATAAAQTTA